ncbi:hypothetical protein PVAND_017556 [Polypedilum vanderplanki]|uniref:Rab-GAP TBC domain-containing protein n=1 Tax=Polypedilum vanderplanki TaxID=319348 RepID=A0A9J6BIE7_POLVA|nr:hypothetical protein PVAND_017556 [Polypedilum vanderplanki]
MQENEIKDEIHEKQQDENSEKNFIICNGKENLNPNSNHNNKQRRNDEPSELSFEVFPENAEEKAKRKLIENALKNPKTSLEEWREFAKSEYGLISDDLRRHVWPLLLNLDPSNAEVVPKLEELMSHPEYNQVVLDVNRSLKRFPPGIPLQSRLALQDQLTVIILRVISKYPHLSYYQGYHDVAVTFLLVCGDEMAFHIMETLSTDHLVECMQRTFEIVQKRLLIIYALIWKEKRELYEFLERSQCGLLFALPWYLTWFGHSLNSYKSVVRLYDFFLASDPLLPLYVTAAIVLYREEEIFHEECDRASLHCLLSQLPDDLPFEYLLKQSEKLYLAHPPHELHRDIEVIIEREKKMREEEDKVFERRRQMIQKKRNPTSAPKKGFSLFSKIVANKKSIVVTTAFSIVIGIFAYYYRSQHSMNVDVIR